MADGHGCLLNLFFAFSSLILGYCPYLSGTNDLFAGKTDTPIFCFGGD